MLTERHLGAFEDVFVVLAVHGRVTAVSGVGGRGENGRRRRY
jgi:hypothetical protein